MLHIDVLHEDGHLLVVNKPAGIVVHPNAGTPAGGTLLDLLRGQGEAGDVNGIVHRLDRDTSGVLLVARTEAAQRALAASFEQRHLRKEYLALVSGVPAAVSGIIERAIARHPLHRERMTTGEGGSPARTDWELVEAFGARAALLRCRIHTGRTHQIRVHLKSAGHPILGDRTYGWVPGPGFPEVPRVMLHAERVAFLHPVTARPLDIRAPLPEDFAALLAALRQG